MTKTARSVVLGMLGYTARSGAIDANPTRETAAITGGRTKGPRVLSLDERVGPPVDPGLVGQRSPHPWSDLLERGTSTELGAVGAVVLKLAAC